MLVGSELTLLAADAEIDKKSEVSNMLGIATEAPNIIVAAIAMATSFFVVFLAVVVMRISPFL